MSPVLFRRKKIRAEATLSQRLLAARQRLNLSIEEAEQATHVRAKYLIALEEGRFQDLPPDVYTLGFIGRYASLLGLEQAALCREFQGERLTAQRLGRAEVPAEVTPVRPRTSLAEPTFVLTPKFVWVAASLVFVLGIAGYVWYQVQGFVAAPELELAAAPEMIVSTPSIMIEGKTETQAELTINAEPIAIGPDGDFTQEVHLASGMNTIEIAARNRLNKETRKQIRVMATY